jgi:uncharacterized protein (DUF433 family)
MALETPTLDRHIEITPGVAGGKPRIAGHRITIQNIAIWHQRLGRSADEIAADHNLTLAEVYAALAYYFDHRELIDASIEAGEAFAEEMRKATEATTQRQRDLELVALLQEWLADESGLDEAVWPQLQRDLENNPISFHELAP